MSDTSTIKRGHTIAVWFSCGAASAIAAKLTLEKYPNHTIRVLNNPIKEEPEDNRRFLTDVEKWLGVKIESVVSEDFPTQSAVDVWAKRRFMSGPNGAPCTGELKRKARHLWENKNHTDHIVLGFTSEEKARHDTFVLTERNNVLPVLIDAKYTKQMCIDHLLRVGIDPPSIYREGYPNANCIGCVKATSPTYWNHVRKTHPQIFADRAAQSRDIGAKLVRVKGERLFLDQLDPTVKGRPLASMSFDCGLFCEEFSEKNGQTTPKD